MTERADRPDLTRPRREPRPAPTHGQDPVDVPRLRAADRPEPKVLRQFRLSSAEDDLLVALGAQRGDRNLIDTQRWLLTAVVPRILDGSLGIDLHEPRPQGR